MLFLTYNISIIKYVSENPIHFIIYSNQNKKINKRLKSNS